MTPDDFKRSRLALGLSQYGLVRELGRSRRQIIAYEKGEAPIPRVVELAMKGLWAEKTPRGA